MTRTAHPAPQRVLVVEADPALGRQLLDVLHHHGYAVHLATTGLQAIARFVAPCQPLPDLVLLSLGLPDLPGADVLQALRAIPGGASIPVVAMSASPAPARSTHQLDVYADVVPGQLVAVLQLVAACTGVSADVAEGQWLWSSGRGSTGLADATPELALAWI